MKTRRTQTTCTFTSDQGAAAFTRWLRANCNDRDYGRPIFIDMRDVGSGDWCVECSYEGEFVRGVATGIEAATGHHVVSL